MFNKSETRWRVNITWRWKENIPVWEYSNHKLVVQEELNSQEINQTKSKVDSIVNQMESIIKVVNDQKEAKSTNDWKKWERAILSNTLNVLTRELERYRNFHTEYDSYGDRLNTSNVEVVKVAY